MSEIDQRRARLAELAEMPFSTHGETWAREAEALAQEIERMNRGERSDA